MQYILYIALMLYVSLFKLFSTALFKGLTYQVESLLESSNSAPKSDNEILMNNVLLLFIKFRILDACAEYSHGH